MQFIHQKTYQMRNQWRIKCLGEKSSKKIEFTSIVPKVNSEFINSIPRNEEVTIEDELLQGLSSELKYCRTFCYKWINLLPDFQKLICCKKFKNIDINYQKHSST